MFALLFVILTSTITFTRTIATSTLRNWDEAWYAEITKNTVSGQFGTLIPFWNGKFYFEHGPLYHWLSAPIFIIFGPGEWQTRVVSTTAAIFACLLIFFVGKKLAGTITGLTSFLVFLTLGGVTIRFSHGNLDSLLVCFSMAAFYFYLLGEKKKPYSFISGIFVGLGFLIKSWGIGLFPLTLIFIYSFVKDKKLPRNLNLIILAGIISSGWWYILGILKDGQVFINWYILNPSEGRLATPLANFSLEYFKFAFRDISLWLIIPAIYLLVRFKNLKLDKNIVIPFSSLSFFYIFGLNFLSDKSDWYLIPALSTVALLVGYFGQLLYKAYPKTALILISIVFAIQIANVIRIENIYPDRSSVGVDLGKHAAKIIPKGSIVALEDQDFTSFLFYSDQTAIYTIQKNGPKPGEWWILKYEDLPKFVQDHQNVWFVSKDPENLNLNLHEDQIKDKINGYSFVKY